MGDSHLACRARGHFPKGSETICKVSPLANTTCAHTAFVLILWPPRTLLMESLLFLGCLIAICAIAAWTIANDKRETPFDADTKVPNAAAREKAPRRSRFFSKP
jgi:hypothetical protein